MQESAADVRRAILHGFMPRRAQAIELAARADSPYSVLVEKYQSTVL